MAWEHGHRRSVWISEEIDKMLHDLKLKDPENYPNTNQAFRVAIMILYRMEQKVSEAPGSEREDLRLKLMRFEAK